MRRLFDQVLESTVLLDVYVVDDGSTDGTATAVRSLFPRAKLLRGNGGLFWNGGTRLAFEAAKEKDYDFYLWINDDTLLDKHAIGGLISSHKELSRSIANPAIIVGSTSDPSNGQLTYGGLVRSDPLLRPLRFQLVRPSTELRECETMNGNCVLIPRDVVKKVGNLDSRFNHGLADYDYGLRGCALDCSIWVFPGYVGKCPRNLINGTWRDSTLPVRDRWRLFTAIKHLPLNEWRIFAHQYGGFFWIIYWLSPYVRFLFTLVCGKLKLDSES